MNNNNTDNELQTTNTENKKPKSKYITVTNVAGTGYREIAKAMSVDGKQMNHATARNICNASIKKFFRYLCEELELTDIPESRIEELSKDQDIQTALSELLDSIKLQEETK